MDPWTSPASHRCERGRVKEGAGNESGLHLGNFEFKSKRMKKRLKVFSVFGCWRVPAKPWNVEGPDSSPEAGSGADAGFPQPVLQLLVRNGKRLLLRTEEGVQTDPRAWELGLPPSSARPHKLPGRPERPGEQTVDLQAGNFEELRRSARRSHRLCCGSWLLR